MSTNTMTVSNLQLFKILKEKLGDSQAEALVEYVDSKVHVEFEERKDTFATKEDIARLEIKIENTSKQTLIWMFGMLVTLLSLAIAAIKFIK
jgi:hypothetical protein